MGGPIVIVWVVTQHVCVDFYFVVKNCQQGCKKRLKAALFRQQQGKTTGILHCHLSILEASTLLHVVLQKRRNGGMNIHKFAIYPLCCVLYLTKLLFLYFGCFNVWK